VNLSCWFGHDWEMAPNDDGHICLRCGRHEVIVSAGGGWGVSVTIQEREAMEARRRWRQRRAAEIAEYHSSGGAS
jgi:hypothetical protein